MWRRCHRQDWRLRRQHPNSLCIFAWGCAEANGVKKMDVSKADASARENQCTFFIFFSPCDLPSILPIPITPYVWFFGLLAQKQNQLLKCNE
jgi:hypothetical protein